MRPIAVFIGVFFFLTLNAQNNFQDTDLVTAYEDFTEMPREVAYVHLNKSIYIKGERIGFNAYLMDKSNAKRSIETTNLYCILSDKNGRPVKEQLIMIQNGVGRGNFELDEAFTSGEYTFRAYTNWMKNFEEQNHYVQRIRIIDPEVEKTIQPKKVAATLDAQFLPEGGHLVHNVSSTVGVVIKNADGFGIPELEGEILDAKNAVVANFKLNQLGIGACEFTPVPNEKYHAQLSYNNVNHRFQIENIEPKGILLALQNLPNKVAIAIKTNDASISEVQGKPYTLAIHNGTSLKILDIAFQDTTEILKVIPHEDLFPGINIFTLFDANNNPISERLFFNFQGLSFESSEELVSQQKNDSIIVQIPFKDLNAALFNNLSVSVLPSETISYKHHYNLPSYLLLQPYVKGTIENASYYFQEVNARKKYDLDNLLLTQGWSSYDWNTIFNKPPDFVYDFEKGIDFTVSMNGKNSSQFLLYPNANSKSELIQLKEKEVTFQKRNRFLLSDEKIRIGEIKATGELTVPKLVLQFKPSKIPAFTSKKENLLGLKEVSILEMGETTSYSPSISEKVQQLDEVIVTKKQAYSRIEKLKNATLGKVEVFDEMMRLRYQYFGNYISERGFVVDEQPYVVDGDDLTPIQQFRIVSRNPNTFNNEIPIIYLDGVLLTDLEILKRFRMDVVDYVEVNRSGIGGGLRGGGGIIKIYTDPKKKYKIEAREVFKEFDIPLTFTTPKRFYTPKYSSTQSTFFKEYGVVDWFPNLMPDSNGTISFKIPNPGSGNLIVHIEGIVNDQSLVSEARSIILN